MFHVVPCMPCVPAGCGCVMLVMCRTCMSVMFLDTPPSLAPALPVLGWVATGAQPHDATLAHVLCLVTGPHHTYATLCVTVQHWQHFWWRTRTSHQCDVDAWLVQTALMKPSTAHNRSEGVSLYDSTIPANASCAGVCFAHGVCLGARGGCCQAGMRHAWCEVYLV